ncbi:hypothetical protein [Kribbella shirazensis]|uniref:Twin-arginine translocation signal domain-containing protein n=1 Tax=Kribbella shirazensis TaxID=1105143 RepID=A0A7X5VDS1_9ACTN|nr:hypothetical protein [Kribbella shirazensis]NIK59307.1 hypothetical protein [Kribbella shirazensis]
MPLTRRSFLVRAGLATMAVGGAAAFQSAPALAAGADQAPVGYGPASLTSAVRGATVIGQSVFISSRFNTPELKLRLAEFDVTTGEARSVDDLAIPSSGGQKLATDGQYVYIGPAGSGHIWRFDPRTKDLVAWAEAGASTTWYYDMVVEGDHLYVGTYPDCTVKRIRVSDGTIETYGRISTSKYATAVAVDDQYVYAGSAAPGTLLVWPKAGGTPTDLTPYLSSSPVGILDLAVKDKTIYVANGRQVISCGIDGSGRVSRDIPEEDRYVDQLTVGADGRVYALARLTTNVYEVTPTGLTKVGQPIKDVENQLLAPLPDGSLLGVSGLGHVWRMAPGGTTDVWQTATRGFGYPEIVQSMLLHSRGEVWVAGHYAMTVHQPDRGSSVRFDINGEPKALAEGARGTVYAGLYPSTQIVAIDPLGHRISVLGLLANEQLRTKRIHADRERNQLLVASSPATTKHTGALTFVDLATNTFDVHREYLPEQSVMDIAVSGTTAYLVGDTYGEGTTGPLRPTAQVAAVDIVTRELIWRAELKPNWASYESVYVTGNLLYAVARRPRGAWLAYDLSTRTIVQEGELGGYGQLNGVDGRVFSWVHWTDDISELPTTPGGAVSTVHDSVPRGWYNDPMFNFTHNAKATWGMHGTDLALFPLPK